MNCDFLVIKQCSTWSCKSCSVVCIACACTEWVAGANPLLFIWFYKHLSLGQPWLSIFSTSFSIKLPEALYFSVSVANISAFASLGSMFWSSLLSKFPLFHTFEGNFLTPKCLSYGFVSFWRTREDLWTFPSTNFSILCNCVFLIAQSLVQCQTYCFKRLQSWLLKAEFYVKAKE